VLLCLKHLRRQGRQQSLLALLRRAGFEGVEMISHAHSPQASQRLRRL
jgi:hypothetical protein